MKETMDFKTGNDVIDFFDTILAFRLYRNENAVWDDGAFDIPLELVTKELGLREKDIDLIQEHLEAYEGDIFVHNGRVKVFGAAN